jgi:hypothetical protein
VTSSDPEESSDAETFLFLNKPSGETKVESHASSETQPNQAALLLNFFDIGGALLIFG